MFVFIALITSFHLLFSPSASAARKSAGSGTLTSPVFSLFNFLPFQTDNIEGTLLRTRSKFLVALKSSDKARQLVQLQATNTSSQKYLSRLNQGDHLLASGRFDEKSPYFFVENVDYVGLKKLLGRWQNSSTQFFFNSFQSLTVLNLRNGPAFPLEGPYRYSLTFAPNNEWVAFVSSFESTNMLVLKFIDDNNLEVSWVDSESGEVEQVIQLTRSLSLR